MGLPIDTTFTTLEMSHWFEKYLAWSLCKPAAEWHGLGVKGVAISDVAWTKFQWLCFSGGMTNYLYLCRLPKGMTPTRGEPHQVLLRIYGHVTTSCMDVLVHNSVVFALLAEKRLGPKPYGMFFDGRIEEFILVRCSIFQHFWNYCVLIFFMKCECCVK